MREGVFVLQEVTACCSWRRARACAGSEASATGFGAVVLSAGENGVGLIEESQRMLTALMW